jgi:hypothetical protein
MALRMRTWVWIIISIVAVCILGIIVMAGAGLYFFSQHIKTMEASPAVAARTFEETRSRFANQPPLLEFDAHGNVSKSHTERLRTASGPKPEAIHVLAYDQDDGRVIRMSIPFWLLRLKSGNARINFGDGDINLEELKIGVEDLERMGPTLLIDQKSPGGDRVLVWSQ